MDAIGYCRVSTQEQEAEGVSLAAQAAKIRAYCELHEVGLIGIETDVLSGKRADNRPALQSALTQIQAGEAQALVVFKLDRLARNTIDALQISEAIRKAGATLHSITEKLDTGSAFGKFFYTMLAALAELERQQISERTRVALQYKRQAGFKTGGTVPFGFEADAEGRLIPHADEQEALQMIRDLRAKGYTYRGIATALERAEILTKQGRREWNPKTIYRIQKSAA